MKIQNKLLLFILGFTIIIYVVAFSLIMTGVRDKVFADAEENIQTQAREYANLITAELNYDFDVTKGMGWAMQSFESVPDTVFYDFYREMLYDFISRNPNFFSTWVSWELNAIDPDYTLPYGRVRQTYYRHGDQVLYQQDTLNLDGDDEGSLYLQVKTDKTNFLSDPYWYTYTGRDEDLVLEVSPCIPLLINGHFAGLAGTDIILDRFQELSQSITPYDVGYTFIISNNGTYVGHPNESFVGEKIIDIRRQYAIDNEVIERISEGEFFTHIVHDNHIGGEAYVAYAPVIIGDTDLPWSVGTVVPMEVIVREANRILIRSVIFALIGLIVLSYIIFYVSRKIAKPLSTLTQVVDKLSYGDLKNTEKIAVNTDDEIGKISSSLNSLLDGLGKTAHFANEIGKGNLQADFELLGDNDELGESLLNMRASLRNAKEEEEKRKEEDKKRSWGTQGHAKFADILRKDNDNMETLSFNVVKNLVKYLEANQGGVFILNDDDENERFLELKACYAYDRQKYLAKKVDLGEGLIGACFLEKKTINLKKVPDDYMIITSGLGSENPSNIIIVPLILNEEVFGVIEIASFKPFEDHEIEFIEKVGESIASTISTVKINIRTKLLLEQSQQQAEEMKAQEEEMRQNMEEMHATQEEMTRKEHTLQNVINATNKYQLLVEYDFNGMIKNVNDFFCKTTGYSKEEIKGQHHKILFESEDYTNTDEYSEFWQKMRTGEHLIKAYKIKTKGGELIECKGIFYPVIDQNGNPLKIMEFAVDISE